MATALPIQEKIKFGIQAKLKEDTFRLQFGGGYTQRIRKGYNASMTTYEISWVALTEPELRYLVAQIQAAGGVELFTWQPPEQTVAQRFSISEHSLEQVAHDRYDYKATLVREFD